MRANTPSQGSFGIPPHVAEAAEKARKEALEKAKNEEAANQAPESDFGFAAEEPKEEKEMGTAETLRRDSDPIEALKKVGITLTEEDFHSILFRGYVEKTVQIFPKLKSSGKDLVATIKTLTGEEYDCADELLAEELNKVQVTNQGSETRQQMWWLSLAVTHLSGKQLVKAPPLLPNGDVDLKALARQRRVLLSKLHPSVSTKMLQLYSAMMVAINNLVDNPEDESLKKL